MLSLVGHSLGPGRWTVGLPCGEDLILDKLEELLICESGCRLRLAGEGERRSGRAGSVAARQEDPVGMVGKLSPISNGVLLTSREMSSDEKQDS